MPFFYATVIFLDNLFEMCFIFFWSSWLRVVTPSARIKTVGVYCWIILPDKYTDKLFRFFFFLVTNLTKKTIEAFGKYYYHVALHNILRTIFYTEILTRKVGFIKFFHQVIQFKYEKKCKSTFQVQFCQSVAVELSNFIWNVKKERFSTQVFPRHT